MLTVPIVVAVIRSKTYITPHSSTVRRPGKNNTLYDTVGALPNHRARARQAGTDAAPAVGDRERVGHRLQRAKAGGSEYFREFVCNHVCRDACTALSGRMDPEDLREVNLP